MSKFEKVLKDKVEIVNQKQAESQRVLVGSLQPQKNHILFEYDMTTNKMRRAEFKKNLEVNFNSALDGDYSLNKQVDIKDGCFYIPALNEKNAWKKLEKRLKDVK